MPWVRRSADADGEGDGDVLLVRLPLAALAPDAASAGEDRGGKGQRDVQLPGVRDILDGRRRTSRLGNILLARHASLEAVGPGAPRKAPTVAIILDGKGGQEASTLVIRGKHVQRATVMCEFGRATCAGDLPPATARGDAAPSRTPTVRFVRSGVPGQAHRV